MEIKTFDIINIILTLYIIYFLCTNNQTISNFTKIKTTVDNSNNNSDNNNSENDIEIATMINKKELNRRDASIVNNKLVAPERRHDAVNYIKLQDKLKINEYTKGEPENYQLVGLLYKENEDKKYQLFGRRIYMGSPEWEYFIGGKDTGGLDYKFPLDIKEEIYDGSTIVNPIDNDKYKVKIYNFDKPRYIPII